MFKKISTTFALFLPGIFLLGFNIGTGSVTAMAKAGATYGMSLLWTIVFSCLVTYVLIAEFGRYTAITGETALQAFRRHIHPAIGVFFIAGLGICVTGSVMGVMGIIADVCSVWSRQFVEGGIAPIWFALFFISLVYVLFLNGRTDFFQKALAIIVAIMSACFIVNFFILMPPIMAMVKGLVPSLPTVSGDSGNGPFLIIASMAGTTVSSGIFIVRSILVKEAGWTRPDLAHQRRDAFVSVVMMFLISFTIMASAAGTLFVQGVGLSDASQMIDLLKPLAGPLAAGIFALGIVAAGVSSQFPNVLLVPWLISDYAGQDRDMRQTRFRIIVFFMSLLGLIVPLFKAKPVVVMVASQALGAIILPATVACIFYLGNRKEVMGQDVNGAAKNILMAAIFIFALFMCFSGLRGLVAALGH